jgi:hypothetical protein
MQEHKAIPCKGGEMGRLCVHLLDGVSLREQIDEVLIQTDALLVR